MNAKVKVEVDSVKKDNVEIIDLSGIVPEPYEIDSEIIPNVPLDTVFKMERYRWADHPVD